ncbi:MAG: isocitrate lyase/phosphoenolpyruvate mutase family protein [Thermodesulfobacteriota bacterium]|nr:isocitrate lyase/phosphoenolpyruvate mutase family protein [Thermodesulfobacteriota bacterium]
MLTKPGVAVGVGAGDALCAKLIEQAGFDFIWSSSLCISASFAVPDANLISMSQYCEAARSMNEVVSIPIIADCDTGYGNANNVIYAVKKFEEAGIAGMSIEDKKFPKDNSLLEGGRQDLAPIEEFVGKIKAAKDHQKNREFIVIARVEALIAGWGQQEAMKRALRYVEAGADCILIHSKSSNPDEILEFVRNWDSSVPLVLVPTNYPSLTRQAVETLGKVKLYIYANQPMRAAVKAQQELLKEIKRSGGIHTIDKMMVPVNRIFDLQGVPKMKEDEEKYLIG